MSLFRVGANAQLRTLSRQSLRSFSILQTPRSLVCISRTVRQLQALQHKQCRSYADSSSSSPSNLYASTIEGLEQAQEEQQQEQQQQGWRRPRRTRRTLQGSDSAPATPNKVLFVQNLKYSLTEDELQEAFSKFGPVSKARIFLNEEGQSRGMALISYTAIEDAQAAIEGTDGTFFDGRVINVSFSTRPYTERNMMDGARGPRRPRIDNPPSRTLYISNLPFDVTDTMLSELFGKLQGTTDVRVAIDSATGLPRGFAHADFTNIAAAEAAMELLSDEDVGGRKLVVGFGKPATEVAKERKERKERAAARTAATSAAVGEVSETMTEVDADAEAAGRTLGEPPVAPTTNSSSSS